MNLSSRAVKAGPEQSAHRDGLSRGAHGRGKSLLVGGKVITCLAAAGHIAVRQWEGLSSRFGAGGWPWTIV